MILLAALIVGLLVGWGAARRRGQPYQAPDLISLWLVPVALLPQMLAVYLPAPKGPAGSWFAVALPLSLILFLIFIWINRRLPGMPLLLAGLLLNLLVIAANGGWMPISPETASHLPGGFDAVTGGRFGLKDILLLPQDTRFELLADRFLFPGWFPYQVAFSLGDILVAAGVFWLLARPRAAPDAQRGET